MSASSYRPLCDLWILTRCKYKNNIKWYGGYLGGFVERARALLGVNINDSVLHVCGGMAKYYPYKRGFGPNDKTLDLDPKCEPDFLADAREPFPLNKINGEEFLWKAILIDPPYTEEDADHYAPGRLHFPKPNLLIRNAINALVPGGRVGIICYHLPSPPKNAIFVAAVGVLCGYNNRIRLYSTFEKLN